MRVIERRYLTGELGIQKLSTRDLKTSTEHRGTAISYHILEGGDTITFEINEAGTVHLRDALSGIIAEWEEEKAA